MLDAGHVKEVIDLAAPSDSPGLLVSLSKDGNIRLWHASHDCCTASYSSDASSLVSHAQAHNILVSEATMLTVEQAHMSPCSAYGTKHGISLALCSVRRQHKLSCIGCCHTCAPAALMSADDPVCFVVS